MRPPSTRASFFIGSALGAFAFVQVVVVLRVPIHVHAVQMWALACAGVFGLTAGSVFHTGGEAVASLTFALLGLMLFYGCAGALLSIAHRRWKSPGVVGAALLLLPYTSVCT
jgi:hypothetical protein